MPEMVSGRICLAPKATEIIRLAAKIRNIYPLKICLLKTVCNFLLSSNLFPRNSEPLFHVYEVSPDVQKEIFLAILPTVTWT